MRKKRRYIGSKFRKTIADLDPIRQFVACQTDQLIPGYLPDGDPTEAPEQIRQQLMNGVLRITDALFPIKERRGAVVGAVLGYPNTDSRRIMAQKLLKQAHEPEYARALLQCYLTHISGIRDHLIDLERECWVLLQLCHDPRLYTRAKEQAMKSVRARGMQPRRRLPMPGRPVLLPSRVVKYMRNWIPAGEQAGNKKSE